MNRFFAIIFAILTGYGAGAQNPDGAAIVMEIDGVPVTKTEFEAIYKKNNRDTVITTADLDEYAELFANFKLKVWEAESLGMDTAAGFMRELLGYREQLARPYLVDKSVTDSLVREAYDRLHTEVRASHILIKLPPNASPDDTLAAYEKAASLTRQLKKNPEKFADLARENSDDGGGPNGGDLGYFTALQMVYPFENAVYTTKVGEVTGPVRTRFGYHVIKVTDRRDARGEVRVAHIMIRSEENDPEDAKKHAKERADEVYNRLKEGSGFAEMATRYSDDRNSAMKVGEIPRFGTGRMVAEFENAAFALEEPGDFTEPIKTPYGWHIIKLLEKIPLGDFATMERDLRARIERDSRSELSKDIFVNRLKKEYGFTVHEKALKPFYDAMGDEYFVGQWKAPEKLAESNRAVFTLGGKDYTQKEFALYLTRSMRPTTDEVAHKTVVDEAFRNFVDASVMEYENEHLEEKYPEFRALMKEYRDGILLFDLTDKKVWSKAVEDSAGLHAYYQNHLDDFMWEERAGYDIYTLGNSKDAKTVRKMLRKGGNQDDVREKLNDGTALAVRVESGMKERGDEPLLSRTDWKEGVYGPYEMDGQYKVVQIKEIRPSQPKAFEEARGLITAGYQNHLENLWVDSLRAEHEIVIHRDVLHSIR